MQKLFKYIQDNIISNKIGIRDMSVSFAPQIASAVFGFAMSIFLARGLGAESLGKYALITSFAALITGFSDLGINQTAIRFASRAVSKNDDELQYAVLRWALRIRFSLVLMLFAISYFVAEVVATDFWGSSELAVLIRINLLIVLFNVFSSIPIIYFQSKRLFGKNAFVAVGQSVINFSGITFIAITGMWSIYNVIIVTVISNLIGMLVFLVIVPRHAIFRMQDFKNGFKEIFRAPKEHYLHETTVDKSSAESFAFFMVITSIIVILTMQADVWLMGRYLTKDQIGIYNVATKLALPLMMFLNAFNTVLWPRASAATSREETMLLLKKTVKVSSIVFLFVLIYSFFAPMLITYIYGLAYDSSTMLSRILCFRYSISILVCPIGIIGYNLGFIRIYWKVNLIQLIFVVLINVFLLPVIGVYASALALIINELTGFAASVLIIRHKIKQANA